MLHPLQGYTLLDLERWCLSSWQRGWTYGKWLISQLGRGSYGSSETGVLMPRSSGRLEGSAGASFLDCALLLLLYILMVYLVPSLRDDWVIQRDHCRELLVFWCLQVYKITSVSHASHKEEKRLYLLVPSIFIPFLVVGHQATGDFSEGCQAMHVSCGWIVSATSNSIHIVGVISSFISSSGASRYAQFGGHPEMTVSYRLITSAARGSLYIFGVSKRSISWWFGLLAIPLMDLYNSTCLMDGPCHEQAMRASVNIFGATKVI
ncbi:predicted protein [Lichtheimia corymbifera JMRC:FSU:9682]|uniref:Uncharacterized protein n=1 Tax=Lichtheimia corymbifera JMRC:FSU:9682 TaxID=1263082 RepID=A0A068SBW3_9FUNG|nr:predicted protein [Lichtheimia corymbifera JMRC:FSU:9682]